MLVRDNVNWLIEQMRRGLGAFKIEQCEKPEDEKKKKSF